jgi:hypothetical protein
MEIREVLQEAEDESACIVGRSANGRLFFIPDSEAERFTIEESDLCKAL